MMKKQCQCLLVVSVLVLLGVVAVMATPPPKPVISFDFQTSATVSAWVNGTFNQTLTVDWYQDYANALDLFVTPVDLEGYNNFLYNLTENSGISYNATNCDWGCFEGKCCNASSNNNNNHKSNNKSFFFDIFTSGGSSSLQEVSLIDEYTSPSPFPSPPAPPSCACAIVAVYRIVWDLYINSTYSGKFKRNVVTPH